MVYEEFKEQATWNWCWIESYRKREPGHRYTKIRNQKGKISCSESRMQSIIRRAMNGLKAKQL